MTLPENYKFIFVDWRKETPVFVRKEDGTDVAVISYNNDDAYVDVNTFAFMYSDGEHIFGKLADGSEVNLLFKTSEGVLILGKKIIDTAE